MRSGKKAIVDQNADTYISGKNVIAHLPRRKKSSHKGAGGKVLIIGGSIDYHGAPILTGLAALSAGCDLVYLYVPDCNFDITRKSYPDFIVKKYTGNYFDRVAAKEIIPFADTCDAIAIGPGLSKATEIERAVSYFVKHVKKPIVVDADAIIHYSDLRKGIVVTPHAGEFQRFSGIKLETRRTKNEERQTSVLKWAKKTGTTILLKGPVDIIVSPKGELRLNDTGNEGMTVGGTGDVLTGTVASFIAQGAYPFIAAELAAYIVGAAGDRLYNRKGIGFRASELADEIAPTIHSILKNTVL